jgi:hypothetical protein
MRLFKALTLAAALGAAVVLGGDRAAVSADVVTWEHVEAWVWEDAAYYGVSGWWLVTVARCEGSGNPYAVGRAGEIGPAQFHPAGIWWALPQSRLVPLDFSAASLRLQVQAMAYAFAAGYWRHWSCAR